MNIDLSFFENKNIQTFKNKIKLIDLTKEIKKLKSSKTILNFAKNKDKIYDLNGHSYVDIQTVIKILREFKNKHTEKMLNELKKQKEYEKFNFDSDVESDDEAVILASKNEVKQNNNDFGKFDFWGHTFNYIIVDEEYDEGEIQPMIYFSGKEIAKFLEYKKPEKAISDHVDNDYKKTLEEIYNFRPPELGGLTYNQKKSIYISKYGLIQLVTKSNKKEAKIFQTKLIEKVVPSLLDKGYYIPNDKIEINWDTSFIVEI